MKKKASKLITAVAILTLIFSFSVQAQVISDGSFESVGATVGNGNSFPTFPTFNSSWTSVDVDGEIFTDDNALDGDWFADLLQNAGQNSTTFWNETSHGWSSGFDRILTTLTELAPNTEYQVIFYHSTQLNRFNYTADQTLVQIQSVQTTNGSSFLFDTPTTSIWQPDTVKFTTDDLTTSAYLLFSPLGENDTSVSIDKISITILGQVTSIETAIEKNDLKIYPNPTSNSLTIKHRKEINAIGVYDITGNQMLYFENLNTKDFELSISQFPVGIYLFNIMDSDGNRQIKRIIKK